MKSTGIKIVGVYPQFANQTIDGVYGGWEFRSQSNIFTTSMGIRGYNYCGVILFDQEGNGEVFEKDNIPNDFIKEVQSVVPYTKEELDDAFGTAFYD